MSDFDEYVKLLVALLALVDVPGNAPVFLQQTTHLKPSDRYLAAIVAGLATGFVLMAFAAFGETILVSFGISIASFKIMGGVVVLLFALHMLGLLGLSDPADTQSLSAGNPVSIGIVPMAVPLFAGPGAITAVMVYSRVDYHAGHDLHFVIVLGVIVTVTLTIIVGLSIATAGGRFIGPSTQIVVNRLLGMIVGALGIEFILAGIAAYFPGFAT